LEEESLDKKKVKFDTSDWTLLNDKSYPLQENGYDCGVFTCQCMDFTARQEEYAFMQKDMPTIRWRMAYDIMVGHLSGSNGTLLSESSFLETTNILNEFKECYICCCQHYSKEIIYFQGEDGLFQYALNCLKRRTLYEERWNAFKPIVDQLFTTIEFFDDVELEYSCVVCLDDKRFPKETLISI
jgi:hypothetical protein